MWILFLSAPAGAQFTSGTILGSVTDPSGAAVPGAVVTATNLDTQFSRSVTTGPGGDYVLVNMPLGNYRVKAEAGGFKAAESGPFTLVVDQKLRSDFKLALGDISQMVEVNGVGATLLQTDQSDMNQVVEQKQITALPLNGRDFFSLLLLTNGLQDTSNDQGGATTNVTFAVNGMRPEANSVTLDGIEMSTIRESDVDMRPNIDAISEFKVLTNAFSAEYGHTAGGVISIQSRAGTNEFHASAYEFLRNEALNAPNFFSRPVDPTQEPSAQNQLYKAPLRQNMFGATLGGPIRKNKLFFFLDYQGYRVHKVDEAFARVPEVPFRSGDFSSLLPDPKRFDPDNPGSGIGIYDPATGSAQLFKDPTRATANNPQGLNIIPANRLHPLGSALINAAALPNLPENFPLGNYMIRQRDQYRSDEAGLRVDYTLSGRDNIFARYRWNDGFSDIADPLARADGPMPGIALEENMDSQGVTGGGSHRDRNNNLAISEVHIFNPRLVNESRFGFHYYRLDTLSHAFGMNLAEKFGFHGVNTDNLNSGLPIIYMSSYTNLGGDDFKPLYFRERSWQLNDNLTWMRGRHSLKTGFEFRPRKQDNYYMLFPAGAFWTANIYSSYYQSWSQGHELADLILGMPGYGWHGRRFGSPVLEDRQYGFFAQDDWKLSERLTLNLGVRYEYATPFFSPTNEIAMFDQTQGKLLIAGQNGVSRYIIQPDKNNWMPRAGLAYKLGSKTTLRAGFGVFFDPENSKRDDVKFNPPFYRQYTTDPYTVAWTFWDAAPPPFTDPGSYPTGYDTTNLSRNLLTGYSEQYNLSVQHELPWALLLEAAYVGSQAHKLPYVLNLNQKPDKGMRPIPNLGNLNMVTNMGDMVFHSGQFKLERRFGRGLFFLASYTFSKSIDNVTSADFDKDVSGGLQNIYRPADNRAVSDWDIPHRIAVSFIYDLPVGKGKQFLSGAHPALNAVLGNWQTTGIFIANSGAPGTVTAGTTVATGEIRPNLVHNPNLPGSQRSVYEWFDRSAFVMNYDANGKTIPGNAGRNILRGPGYVNMDLGLMKHFPVTERARIQFRAEFFNMTNTPHFALPVRKMSDSRFGMITHTRSSGSFGSTATSYANRMVQFALKVEF
jgi:outer membrane receptor protein involved in Fe transport